MNILLFICGASIVITIHEFGHYLMIRFCRFKAEEFSIGIGPKLLSFTKKGTKFIVRLIPLGGYVTSTELDPSYESSTDSMRLLHIKKILCYLAGPLFSLLFFIILLFTTGNLKGLRVESISNQQLVNQGIQKNDTLRNINNNKVFNLSDIPTLLYTEKENILTFTRDGEDRIYVQYTNSFLGIEDIRFVKQSFQEKLNSIIYVLKDVVQVMSESLHELFTGKAAIIDDVYNPYSHYDFGGKLSFVYYFNLFLVITAVFSWCLFIFNLLPIIGFDGFKIIYSLIPVIINRKLSKVTLSIVYGLGLIISIWIIF